MNSSQRDYLKFRKEERQLNVVALIVTIMILLDVFFGGVQ